VAAAVEVGEHEQPQSFPDIDRVRDRARNSRKRAPEKDGGRGRAWHAGRIPIISIAPHVGRQSRQRVAIGGKNAPAKDADDRESNDAVTTATGNVSGKKAPALDLVLGHCQTWPAISQATVAALHRLERGVGSTPWLSTAAGIHRTARAKAARRRDGLSQNRVDRSLVEVGQVELEAVPHIRLEADLQLLPTLWFEVGIADRRGRDRVRAGDWREGRSAENAWGWRPDSPYAARNAAYSRCSTTATRAPRSRPTTR
jgi:hypothetical protein